MIQFSLNFEKTPNSSTSSLCDRCRHSFIARGSNGEKIIQCADMNGINRNVLIKVTECKSFVAFNRQMLHEMERDAWILGTKKVVGLAGGRPEDEVQVTWSKPKDREAAGQKGPTNS